MRADDMKEAINIGLLDIEGKLSESTSTRLSHGALTAIDVLAAMDDIKRSDWIREACIEKLLRLKRQHQYLSKAFGESTNTSSTLNTKEKSPTAVTAELDLNNS